MTALPRSIRNAALMSAAAALLLAACGAAPTAAPPAAATAVPPKPTAVPVASGPKKGGTLIAARSEDMKGLDPHKQTAFASFRMLELVYDPLLTFDKDMKVIPNLAESFKLSDDAKTLTIVLRKGVKFHKGQAMTSEDVKYTFERIADEKTAAAARSTFAGVDSIETPDANTVIFKLKAANGALPAAMTNINSAILSKAWVTGGADPAKESNGTGAFKIANWETDKVLKLERNADFWLKDLPRLDGIEFRVIPDEATILAGLRAKTLDWAFLNDPRVGARAKAEAGLTTWKSTSLSYHVLQLNAARDAFKDLKVRQAISCAIDRQEVLNTAALGDGVVTSPATPPYYAAPQADLFCYKKDEAKAMDLMKAAGNPAVKFKVIAATGEPPTAVNEAQSIQAQLKKINIEMEIESLETSVYVARWLAGDFDAAIALNGGNPDPDAMFYRYWHSTGNLNKVAGYKDPEIDKLLDQGRAVSDPNARKAIYNDIQKKLAEAAPWVWLYTGNDYRAGQTFVKDFTPLSNGSILYLREVWMDK
ncbi:MAG: hypothetical protein KA750_04115 [Thermoflexales bacterium]|nr:hypothetical protein [Thermoflexales bacterium]MBP8240922.1 hypothetical protein [Thermoflexales bacterium]